MNEQLLEAGSFAIPNNYSNHLESSNVARPRSEKTLQIWHQRSVPNNERADPERNWLLSRSLRVQKAFEILFLFAVVQE